MATISFQYASGRTLYALLRDEAGQIWDGGSFVAYSSGDYTDYAITLTEQGASGYYQSADLGLADGTYPVAVIEQPGDDPDESDAEYWSIGAGPLVVGVAGVVAAAVAAAVVDAIYPMADGTLGRQAGNTYTVYRGEDAELLITLPGAFDLEDAELEFSVSAKPGKPVLFEYAEGSGLEIIDADERQLQVTLPATDTGSATLPAQATSDLFSAYHWDVWRTESGHKTSISQGRLQVFEGVRRPD